MSTATARVEYWKTAPQVMHAMVALQKVANSTGLEPSLLELVKLRTSQINGCAYCLDRHLREARAAGESDERLALLACWQELDLFTNREREALRWTEAMALLPERGVSDEVFAGVRAHFSEEELAGLTLVIVAIEGWNRLNVGFRVPPGSF